MEAKRADSNKVQGSCWILHQKRALKTQRQLNGLSRLAKISSEIISIPHKTCFTSSRCSCDQQQIKRRAFISLPVFFVDSDLECLPIKPPTNRQVSISASESWCTKIMNQLLPFSVIQRYDNSGLSLFAWETLRPPGSDCKLWQKGKLLQKEVTVCFLCRVLHVYTKCCWICPHGNSVKSAGTDETFSMSGKQVYFFIPLRICSCNTKFTLVATWLSESDSFRLVSWYILYRCRHDFQRLKLLNSVMPWILVSCHHEVCTTLCRFPWSCPEDKLSHYWFIFTFFPSATSISSV